MQKETQFIRCANCEGRGVYAIFNKRNGKIYVGSANDMRMRYYSHKHALKSNKHSSRTLQTDYNNGDVMIMFRIAKVKIFWFKETSLERYTLREYEYMAMFLLKSYIPEYGYNSIFVDLGIQDKTEVEIDIIIKARMLASIAKKIKTTK